MKSNGKGLIDGTRDFDGYSTLKLKTIEPKIESLIDFFVLILKYYITYAFVHSKNGCVRNRDGKMLGNVFAVSELDKHSHRISFRPKRKALKPKTVINNKLRVTTTNKTPNNIN